MDVLNDREGVTLLGMEITFCWTCHLSKIWAADQPYFQAVPGPLVPQAEWLIRIMPSTTRGVQRAGSSHLQAVCLAVGNQLVLSKIGVAFHFLDSWAHRGHTEQIVNLLTAEAGQSQCLHQPISHQSLQSLSHFLVVNGSIVDSPISILRKRVISSLKGIRYRSKYSSWRSASVFQRSGSTSSQWFSVFHSPEVTNSSS